MLCDFCVSEACLQTKTRLAQVLCMHFASTAVLSRASPKGGPGATADQQNLVIGAHSRFRMSGFPETPVFPKPGRTNPKKCGW